MSNKNEVKYMIHAHPKRGWYVYKYLIPQMLEQGIRRNEIIVQMDDLDLGNLEAFITSLEELPAEGTTWHLQDDVLLSTRFASATKELSKEPIVTCGFCGRYDENPQSGFVEPEKAWYSFQCIMIPNEVAHRFLKWFNLTGAHEHEEWFQAGKYDDSYFHEFLIKKKMPARNLSPNIVEHIDYLLGGSIANKKRKGALTSLYWIEHDVTDKLKDRLLFEERSS